VGGGVTGPDTFNVALAGSVLLIVAPSPRADNTPAGIVLIKFPIVLEVTLMVTVQRPGVDPAWPGTVPPLKDKDVEPGLAVTEPPQLLVRSTGLAMLNPGCTPTRLSVQDASVRANGLGLYMVTLKRATPPGAMESGSNPLLISAGRVMTWAFASFLGMTRMETSSATTTKGMNGLRIFILSIVRAPLKQMKPTQHGRFRHWLAIALSSFLDRRPNWAMGLCSRKQDFELLIQF
jgi:hypothetical protein